jgi:ABC-type sugar transport system permease subunit
MAGTLRASRQHAMIHSSSATIHSRPFQPAGSPREALATYPSISTWLVGFVVFQARPLLVSLYNSLTDSPAIQSPRAGLVNCRQPIAGSQFWQLLRVTAISAAALVPWA